PETMERLYRAVNKVPSQQAASAPSPSAQVQPFERAEQPDRRFGINSLINRMAGQSAQEKPAEFQRRQPPVNQFDEDVDNYPQEDDRVEIPAFLRRQAN
ncbi:MAG: cell division protein FtsZ, partial [Paracoccaceae bacterium]|nr:cell division protein FtsZ [Paracoccaceae bacterium]